MKRLIAVIGAMLVLIGARYYDAGLRRYTTDGELTVFAETEYTPDLFAPTGADTYRIDLIGGRQDVDKLLKDCRAIIRITEMDGRLIYAYSPNLPQSEWVHGKRINIMIYTGEHSTVIGVPIIKGSY